METVEEVRQAAESLNLVHRWEALQTLLRSAIRLTYDETIPPDTLPLGASRIGGLPDFPPEWEWPVRKGKNGAPDEPMLFLTQINLADIAPLDDQHLLPPTGILYFFACVWVNWITGSGDGLWAARYFNGDMTSLQRNTPSPPIPDSVKKSTYWSFDGCHVKNYQYRPVAFRLSRYWTLPDRYNPHDPHPYLDSLISENSEEDVYDALDDTLRTHTQVGHPDHQMLGWMKGGDQLIGASIDHVVLLLQLDSNWSDTEITSDFRWEFVGRGWFLIEPEDLANRDFSRVELLWKDS